jgi:hypothetical protein
VAAVREDPFVRHDWQMANPHVLDSSSSSSYLTVNTGHGAKRTTLFGDSPYEIGTIVG